MCYLYLFEHFWDWFAVELLACLSVGIQNLLHCHILGCRDKTAQRHGQKSEIYYYTVYAAVHRYQMKNYLYETNSAQH